MKPFKQIGAATEKDLDRIQANIALFASNFANIPLLDGRLIEDVALSGTASQIAHKLGRDYRGWIIVKKNAQQDIWASSTSLSGRFLTLSASGTVTASLWVF